MRIESVNQDFFKINKHLPERSAPIHINPTEHQARPFVDTY